MNFEQARFNMVEQQIRPWDVLDQTILDLLMQVRREDYVPAAHQLLAFSDTEIALTAAGATKGEVMLAPKYDAKMLQELQLTKDHSVLEIGSGSGYATALLGKLAGQVTSLEINQQLVQLATHNLARNKIANAKVIHADGSKWQTQQQFDVITLSGSVGVIPTQLSALLKQDGRLFAYLGQSPVMKAVLITKTSSALVQSVLFETDIAPLQGFAKAPSFVF